MATQESINAVRLRICDPFRFINIVEVATLEALPSVPVAQTCYHVQDTGYFYDYDLAGNPRRIDVLIANDRLSFLIDAYGEARAASRAVKDFISALGKELSFVKLQSGVEATQFQTLRDTLDFYKELAASFEEEAQSTEKSSTGRMFRVKQPQIGGME